MKELKDFEKELNKCSKCGLCESVCPLYKIDPNDCVASKGKFIMLHGVTKGDLKLSAKINKYIDTCLKCGKCNEFCPSGIDVCKILSVAKHDYMKDKVSAKFIHFLLSRKVFGLAVRIGQLFSRPFRPKYKYKKGLTDIIYFKGCVNEVFPNTDRYINKIFENRINIIEPDFECCGLPFLSEGDLKRFEQVARHNLKLFSKDCDYIVTDCASCESTLFSYPNYIVESAPIVHKTYLNWGDVVVAQGLKFKYKKPLRVTFHKPCHLQSDDFFELIMKNCENIEYVKMEDYASCCGFAGSFALKNPKLSADLVKQKALNIKNTNADYVITTCPSCILGLKKGLASVHAKTKVVSLLEFLAKSSEIN